MLKKIFEIIGAKHKKKIIKLQILIIISSILELFGVTLIIPFMSVVNKKVTIETSHTLAEFSSFFHIDGYRELVIVSGCIVLFTMIVSSLCGIFTLRLMTLEANKIGIELSNDFFLSYLRKPWVEHISYRSSRIINITTIHANSLVNGIILPLLTLNSKIMLVLLFSLMLLIVNPFVTILSLVLFVTMYAIIFVFLKDRLVSNSVIISDVYNDRVKILNEVSGSVKDILLKRLSNSFYTEFKHVTSPLPVAMANNGIYSSAPRYMVEMIAYIGVILTILVLFIMQSQSLEDAVGLLFLFALSALKLLPAAQQAYAAISTIKGNSATVSILHSEVKSSVGNGKIDNGIEIKAHGFNKLLAKNINFTYPNKDEKAVSGINFSLSSGESIAFVGPSGSGKSTLIDIVLGLLEPQSGEISISAQGKDNLKPNQISSLIGYVPQSIYILDRTVAENVAFGVNPDEIDYEKVKYALKVAQCEFVYELSDGLDTILGERGIELSGGQRQRIAIARSMYNIPEILVFDEATSALDGQTEKAIVKVINELPKGVTKIMIAHRLTTVKECDKIYFLEKGKIADQGTYEELYQRNHKFKIMAN